MQVSSNFDAGGVDIHITYSDAWFLFQAFDAFAEKLGNDNKDPRPAEFAAAAFLAVSRACLSEFHLRDQDADTLNHDWTRVQKEEAL
jgi:hypothetical protein